MKTTKLIWSEMHHDLVADRYREYMKDTERSGVPKEGIINNKRVTIQGFIV